MIRKAFTLAAALLLAACSADTGKVYNVAIDDAHHALQEMDIPPLVFASEGIQFKVTDNQPNKISWTVARDGNDLIEYDATLTSVDDKSTRVLVEAHAITEGKTGGDPKALDNFASVLAMYKAAMQERVSSTLEHRAYDVSAIYPYLGAAMATNMGAIRKRMDEESAAQAKEQQDTVNRAYAQESSSQARSDRPSDVVDGSAKPVPFGQADPSVGKPMLSIGSDTNAGH